MAGGAVDVNAGGKGSSGWLISAYNMSYGSATAGSVDQGNDFAANWSVETPLIPQTPAGHSPHTCFQLKLSWECEMPEAQKPLLLLRLARSRRTARAPDPAEMGTAFGLDYILAQAAGEALAADAAAAAGSPIDWFRRWWPAKPPR